jgi:hypothetical protein
VAPGGEGRRSWPSRLGVTAGTALLAALGVSLVGLLFGDTFDWAELLVTAGVLFALWVTERWWAPPVRSFFGTDRS